MEYRGASAYDDDQFFKKYMNRRSRVDSPNNSIEKPILLELLSFYKKDVSRMTE